MLVAKTQTPKGDFPNCAYSGMNIGPAIDKADPNPIEPTLCILHQLWTEHLLALTVLQFFLLVAYTLGSHYVRRWLNPACATAQPPGAASEGKICRVRQRSFSFNKTGCTNFAFLFILVCSRYCSDASYSTRSPATGSKSCQIGCMLCHSCWGRDAASLRCQPRCRQAHVLS